VVEYNGCAWISKRSIRALCSGTSVRNITIRKRNVNYEKATREEEDLVCALIEHYPLQNLSLVAVMGGTISSCIKSMLGDSNSKCKLESLSLYNIGEFLYIDMNLSRIVSRLANNISVKTMTCSGAGHIFFLISIPRIILRKS
jgi:hypothetical protein